MAGVSDSNVTVNEKKDNVSCLWQVYVASLLPCLSFAHCLNVLRLPTWYTLHTTRTTCTLARYTSPPWNNDSSKQTDERGIRMRCPSTELYQQQLNWRMFREKFYNVLLISFCECCETDIGFFARTGHQTYADMTSRWIFFSSCWMERILSRCRFMNVSRWASSRVISPSPSGTNGNAYIRWAD